jgi:hypothetical protein
MVGATIISTLMVHITKLSGQITSIPIGCLWISATATSNIIGEAKVTQG